MRKATEPRKEQLKKLWFRFRFIAAITSPFGMLALSIEGSLGTRLLGAAVLLLIPVCVLYSYRWVAYVVGILFAVGQRREEIRKGEENDAKNY